MSNHLMSNSVMSPNMPKTILLTGASRGIGRATAELLASQGHRLALVARDSPDLHEVAAATSSLALPADISLESNATRAVQEAIHHFGHLDALICNAGVGSFTELEHFSPDEFDRIFATNVRGTFLLCRAAIPHFKERRQGHVIGITSDVARRTFPHGTAYGASKYAQDALLGSLRKEVRPHNIKVSIIYPGLVDTSFNNETPNDPAKAATHLRPHDIAQAIAYVLHQPPGVVVDELTIHPLSQEW